MCTRRAGVLPQAPGPGPPDDDKGPVRSESRGPCCSESSHVTARRRAGSSDLHRDVSPSRSPAPSKSPPVGLHLAGLSSRVGVCVCAFACACVCMRACVCVRACAHIVNATGMQQAKRQLVIPFSAALEGRLIQVPADAGRNRPRGHVSAASRVQRQPTSSRLMGRWRRHSASEGPKRTRRRGRLSGELSSACGEKSRDVRCHSQTAERLSAAGWLRRTVRTTADSSGARLPPCLPLLLASLAATRLPDPLRELSFLKFRLISRIYRTKMVRGRIIVSP